MKKRFYLFLVCAVLLFSFGCGDETRETQVSAADNVYGFGMNNTLWWSFPFFNTFGAEFIRDGKCVLNEEPGVDALQFKVDLYNKYEIEAGAWRAGAIDPESGFINERYAMIFNGPWAIHSLREAGVNFGVSLIPEGPEGTSTNVGGTNMVVFRNSENPYWAAKFLEYVASEEVQADWGNKLEQIPVNLKAYDKIDTVDKPFLATFMEQMKYAKARPQIQNYSDLEEIVNPQMEAALQQEKTVSEALNDAVKRIHDRVLDEEAKVEFSSGEAEDYSTETGVEISLWVTYNPTEMEVFNEIASSFMQKNPGVTVNVEQIPWGGHEENILTSLATKTTPDIARVDASFVYKLIVRNALYNLSQFGLDYLKEELVPATLGSCTADGKLWATPDQVTGVALFYNKDMFAEKGLDPQAPPQTWEEFVEFGKILTETK
ncbi:MAG: extracellular solute-binding protein [Candidatus Muiribacteriota bacterium]